MIFTRISFKGLGNSYLIISIHISFPKVNTMLSHFRLCQDQTWAPIFASHRYHSHSWYHYHHRQFDDNDDSNVLGKKRRLRLKRISWKILGSINHSFKETFQEKGAKSISCQSKSVSWTWTCMPSQNMYNLAFMFLPLSSSNVKISISGMSNIFFYKFTL